MAKRLAAIALFTFVAGAAVRPVRSYDFFWHLTTGRWIVEHRALPSYDAFALASAHVPWINGEWLYEIALYGTQSAMGFAGVSWISAFLAGIMFAMAFWFAARTSDAGAALLLSAVAFAG